MKNHSVPFARSYWVEPGKLLAGCYPGAKDPKEAEAKLKSLLASGIRVLVNLMEEDELGHHGEPFVQYERTLQEMAEETGRQVQCVRMPIRDLTVPNPEFMTAILDKIWPSCRRDRSLSTAGVERDAPGRSWDVFLPVTE